MNFKSIKWRLQAWHGFLLVALVAGLMSGFYTFERRARLQAVDTALQGTITPLLPKLAPVGSGRRGGPPEGRGFRRPPPEDEPREFDRDFPDQQPGGFRPRPGEGFDMGKFYYASWSPENRRVAVSTNAPTELTPDERAAPNTPGSVRTVGVNREWTHHIPNGYRVMVGRHSHRCWRSCDISRCGLQSSAAVSSSWD